MRILVTGGSGFIGTRLVKELLARGHEVRILDKVRSTSYPDLCSVGDVRDSDALDAAVRQRDVVYHLAAEHRDDVRPLSLYYEVNVDGSRKLAEACTANGVRSLIFTSSVAVYGMNAGEPTENMAPHPFNDYGRSKSQAEDVLRSWATEGMGRTLVIVRPAAIFGEGNRGNVYNLARQIASGRFVMVGNGLNKKSMGYVGNMAAFLACLDQSLRHGIRVYNYADKPDLTMNELVELVRHSTGKHKGSPARIPYWLGMLGGVCLDGIAWITGRQLPISSIRVRKFCSTTTVSVQRLHETGFVPPSSLREGMEVFLADEFGQRDP